MKKTILTTFVILTCSSFLFSGTMQPSLSMRFDDITGSTDDIVEPNLVLGFAMSLEDGIYAGFDSDGTDSRIFVSFDYGTIGMGISGDAVDPHAQFTIGAKYDALSNLEVCLDYIVNNLAATATPNELRLSLGVTF